MKMLKSLTLLLCWFPAIAGCATKAKSHPFDQVERTIADRLGMRVRWNQGVAADAEVADAVKRLLAQPLSAEQAVQIAFLNDAQLQAAYEEIGLAQAQLVQAGLLRNPVFDFTPRWSTKSGLQFSYEATVTQDFLDILLIPLRKKMARANLLAAQMRISHQVIDAAAEVRRTYYRLTAARQLAEMRHTAADAADASAEVAQSLRAAGNLTQLALAQELKQAAQARIDWADAQAQADELREELAVRMGLWGQAGDWSTAQRLPDPPEEEIAGGQLESLAVANRLDLAAAKEEIIALAQQKGLTDVSRFPFALGAYAEKEPEPGGGTLLGPTFEFAIPLFDHGQGSSAEAAAQWRRGWARYRALAVQVRGEIRRAYRQLLAARARARFYRMRVLPIEQDVVDQTQLQYNAMQIGAFDLLRARRDQVEAGGQYIESLRDYWLARTELERAVGGRLAQANAAPAPSSHVHQADPKSSEAEHP